MTIEREYVITLNSRDDLDSFYNDMETPGGNLYIPNRAVSVHKRRPVSRNTHYMLTDEEASIIRNDPRVLDVELSMEEAGLTFSSKWQESSVFWDKSNIVSSTYKNWALLRCIEGDTRVSWGSNGTKTVAGDIQTNASGKYVDVVIVDGHFDPGHPEFAVNSDGTGGTRVNQYNWLSLIPDVVGSGSPGTYVYTPYIDPTYPDNDGDGYPDRTINNDHGSHVAGIACGNSQGWARDATIYNISPYLTNPNISVNFSASNIIDYIRVWHLNKDIDPALGFRRPTITNHSYGLVSSIDITLITSVTYRGTTYTGPFTDSELTNYGIINSDGFTSHPVRNTAYEQDLLDFINVGGIVIGSAGNEYVKIANYSSDPADDYNNYYSVSGTDYYYNRGTISSAVGILNVGAISALVDESKNQNSNCGPRVDVYAPGQYIMSSVNSTLGVFSDDVRNTSYKITKKSGTSMATPQVTGAIACLAESWPRLTQAEAISYVTRFAKDNQITATTGGVTDYTDLQGSSNKYFYFFKERKDTGQVSPKQNQGIRPSSGVLYPRTKIFRYGR